MLAARPVDGDLDPVLGEQPLRRARIGTGQAHGRHLREHLRRRDRLGAEHGDGRVARSARVSARQRLRTLSQSRSAW